MIFSTGKVVPMTGKRGARVERSTTQAIRPSLVLARVRLVRAQQTGSRNQVTRYRSDDPSSGPDRYDISWRGRGTPSFFIRLRSVLGWTPRICAAPSGPATTP